MPYFSNTTIVIFVIFFIGFFILGACAIKYLYERRLRNQLQNELNTLLYEYVAMDDTDVETITFFNSGSITNSNDQTANKNNNSGKSSGSSKQQAQNNLSHMVRV